MARTVADKIQDLLIMRQVYFQSLSTGQAKKALKEFARLERDILARIEKVDITRAGLKRQKAMLKAIRKLIKSGMEPVVNSIKESVKTMAYSEVAFQAQLLKNAIPIVVDVITPSPSQVLAAVSARPFQGRLLKDIWRGPEGIGDASFRRVRQAVRTAFLEGTSTEQLVRNLKGTAALKYKDGILNKSRNGIMAVTKTALNHTANVSRNEVYKSNKKLVKSVKYVATLDSRTTLRCASLDGKVFPVDKGPRPPQHMGCRSTTVPVIRSYKELGSSSRPELKEGTRTVRLRGRRDLPDDIKESLSGQVPASVSYGKFLEGQSNKFQAEVLGVRKSVLFRKGKLPIERFTDKKGKTLTWDELRIREKEAFELAGLD